jgi:hypothetical protein
MDTTVWVAIIVAVPTLAASLGVTLLNNKSSNNRFKIELGRALDIDQRTRRWEVRAKPLLKLRDELASLASSNQKLIVRASMLHTNISGPFDPNIVKKLLEDAITDLNSYIDRGEFDRVLFSIDDQQIIDKVNEIISDYRTAYFYNTNWQSFLTKLPEALQAPKNIGIKVRDVQSLINDRLEKL